MDADQLRAPFSLFSTGHRCCKNECAPAVCSICTLRCDVWCDVHKQISWRAPIMFHFMGASAEQRELYSLQGINRPRMIDDLVVHYREVNRRLCKQGERFVGCWFKEARHDRIFCKSLTAAIGFNASRLTNARGFRNVLSRLMNWTFNAFLQCVSHLLQMHEDSDLVRYAEVHFPLNDLDVYPSRPLSVMSRKENTGSGCRTKPT